MLRRFRCVQIFLALKTKANYSSYSYGLSYSVAFITNNYCIMLTLCM